MAAAESSSSQLVKYGDTKFFIGQLVWAKVKGYTHYPAKIVDETTVESIQQKKRLKKQVAAQFFPLDVGNYGFPMIQDVEPFFKFREYRETKNKTGGVKKALEAVDEYLRLHPEARNLEKEEDGGTEETEALGLAFPKKADTPAQREALPPAKGKKNRKPGRPPVHTAVKREVAESGSADEGGPSKKARKGSPNTSVEVVEGGEEHTEEDREAPKRMAGGMAPEGGTSTPPVPTTQPKPKQDVPLVELDGDSNSDTDVPRKENAQPEEKKLTASPGRRLRPKVCTKKIGVLLDRDPLGLTILDTLVLAGHSVVAWFRGEKKRGGGSNKWKEMSSPEGLVQNSQVIFSFLKKDADLNVEEAFTMKQGLMDGLKKQTPSGFVLCSPVGHDALKVFKSMMWQYKFPWLAAPMSGSVVDAREGRMKFVCSGNEAMYHEYQSVFSCLGNAIIFLDGKDETGAGVAKSAMDMVKYAIESSVGEARALMDSLGLPAKNLKEQFKMWDFGKIVDSAINDVNVGKDEGGHDLSEAKADMDVAVAHCLRKEVLVPVTRAVHERIEVGERVGWKGSVASMTLRKDGGEGGD